MRLNRRVKGFTLLEFVLVILIMGIISVVIGKILQQGYQTFITSQNIAAMDWNGLLALERLANDIHGIDNPGTDITTMSATQFTFNDLSGASISYIVSASNLTRSGNIVANNVNSVAFKYLDENGNETTTKAAVVAISITLDLFQGDMSTSFTTLVAVRGFS